MPDAPLLTPRTDRGAFFAPLPPTPARKRTSPQQSEQSGQVGQQRPNWRGGIRPDIEGMRAISIILVVLYHAGVKQLPGGYIGVDVFFVISGFLITSHLVREIETGMMSLAKFYTRRALRLLPAATLVIAATLGATWYWAPVTRLKSITWDSIAANLYAINYRLADLGTDYRNASAPPSPLQHFWSLAVEEQFYLVIPLLLIGIGLLRRRVFFVLALAAITAASLAWSIVYTESNPTWAYFSTSSRAWELGAGAVLAVTVTLFDRIPQPLLIGLRWAGVAAIGVAAYKFTERTPFPSYWAGLPVLGAMAIIAGGQRDARDPVLGNPLFLWVGARSYSWYLWHWPVLTLAPFVLHKDLTLTYRLGAVTVALGFAWFSYEVFEHPMRENRDLRDNPRAAFKFTGLLTAAVLALAVALPYAPPHHQVHGAAVAEVSLTGNGSKATKELGARIEASAATMILPENLSPTLGDAAKDQPDIYANGCHQGWAGTKIKPVCENLGVTKGAKKTVVLFGDSHAAQWYPALDKLAARKANKWRLVVYTKSSCSAATVDIFLPAINGPYDDCRDWRSQVIKKMNKTKPDMIIMASNWKRAQALKGGNGDDVWIRGWQDTIAALAKSKAQLIYLNDTPWPKTNIPDCLSLHTDTVRSCLQGYKPAAQDPHRLSVLNAIKDIPTVKVIDPIPWFCTPQVCPPVIGYYMVYMDQSHVSPEYARLIAPLLGEQLKAKAKKRKK